MKTEISTLKCKETLLEIYLISTDIYIANESGMPLDHCLPRIIPEKGQKKVQSWTLKNKVK